MRTDPRYTRVRDMLLAPEVPRLSSGGIALCHICQRNVYFRGGLIQLLIRHIKQMTREIRNKQRAQQRAERRPA